MKWVIRLIIIWHNVEWGEKMDKLDKQNFYDFQNGISLYKPTDKIGNIHNLINSYLNKTLAMFQYSNLPETLPDLEIEKILQIKTYQFV